jgi:uncharacterized protein YukE
VRCEGETLPIPVGRASPSGRFSALPNVGAMQRLTSPEQLEQLAQLLGREAGELDHVLTRLRGQVAATHGCWEGRVADSFRSHAGPRHRQHHLRVARDRLREAARLARLAAAENRAAQATAGRRSA